MKVWTAEQSRRWVDATEEVVAARDAVWFALERLDLALVVARDAGATWDELAYATGQTRTTVRRWHGQVETPRQRRFAILRETLPRPRTAVGESVECDVAAAS